MDHLHDGEALDELKVQQQHVSDRTETSLLIPFNIDHTINYQTETQKHETICTERASPGKPVTYAAPSHSYEPRNTTHQRGNLR